MSNLLIDLLKRTKLRNSVGNEPKYYPNAGPARREGLASMEALLSFGSEQEYNRLPGDGPEILQPTVIYLNTEDNDILKTENDIKLIVEIN